MGVVGQSNQYIIIFPYIVFKLNKFWAKLGTPNHTHTIKKEDTELECHTGAIWHFLSCTLSRQQLFAHHIENLVIHLNLRLWGLIEPRMQLHLCQRSKCLIIMRHASMISPPNKYALQPYFIFSNPEANKELKAEVMDSKMRQLKALWRRRLIVLLITNTKPAQFRHHCARQFSYLTENHLIK